MPRTIVFESPLARKLKRELFDPGVIRDLHVTVLIHDLADRMARVINRWKSSGTPRLSPAPRVFAHGATIALKVVATSMRPLRHVAY